MKKLPPSIPPRCLSRQQAAEYLGISPELLDREVAAGNIKRLKIGRRVVFDRTALDHSLDNKSGLLTPATSASAVPSPSGKEAWLKAIRNAP